MAIEVKRTTTLLQVYDMATSVRFYRDKVGFEVEMTDGRPAEECDWCMLKLGDTNVMLNTRYEGDERPPAPDPKRVEAHDDTAIYFGCPDVDAAHEELKARGLETEKPWVTHYKFKMISFRDPDGFTLIFHWPVG